MNNKVQTAIKGSALVLAVLLASGCTSIENRLDALESKVGQLEQEVAAANANDAATLQAAEAAQITADEALAVAVESAECCVATNEKIDRMFQRSQSK
jgi:outer membrane murein-binding lipoprotein Lpp